RLCVRHIGPSHIGSLIPCEAQPAQRLHLRLDAALDISRLVGVLDSQKEPPAVVPREQPAKQRRPHVPEMRLPRRARSIARPNSHLIKDKTCGKDRFAAHPSRPWLLAPSSLLPAPISLFLIPSSLYLFPHAG